VHSIYARTPTVPVTIQRDATVALDYVLFVDTAAKDSARGGKETPLFAPFIYKMHRFTKTGSGQT
jgi:hypothetical protein